MFIHRFISSAVEFKNCCMNFFGGEQTFGDFEPLFSPKERKRIKGVAQFGNLAYLTLVIKRKV